MLRAPQRGGQAARSSPPPALRERDPQPGAPRLEQSGPVLDLRYRLLLRRTELADRFASADRQHHQPGQSNGHQHQTQHELHATIVSRTEEHPVGPTYIYWISTCYVTVTHYGT